MNVWPMRKDKYLQLDLNVHPYVQKSLSGLKSTVITRGGFMTRKKQQPAEQWTQRNKPHAIQPY